MSEMEQQRRNHLIIFLVVLAVLAGMALYTRAGSEPDRDWTTAFQVMTLVKFEYVDPVNFTDLFTAYVHKGTISGMLSVLKDPYTRYMDPKGFQEMEIDTSGEFGGIGIYVQQNPTTNQIQVEGIMKGTPAEKVGVKPGDIILEINSKSTKDLTVDEAVAMMRGPKGTKLQIVVGRGAEMEHQAFNITREIINVPNVEYRMADKARKIGYVQLSGFNEKSPGAMEDAVRALEREGMKGLILDLRFNPGGLMLSSVEIAKMFVKEGPILHAVGRNPNDKESYYANGTATHTSYPMVVLVNRASASASEILAGALQDNKRAVLVGTRTFGKGLVQRIIPLKDGSALSLTTQKWYTAGGHSIAATGVVPEVIVRNPGDAEMEQQLAKLQAAQKNPEPEAKVQKEKEDEKKKTEPEKPAPQDFKDYQMEKALELLREAISKHETLPLAG